MRRTSSYQQYMRYYTGSATAYAVEPAIPWEEEQTTVRRYRRKSKRKTVFRYKTEAVQGISARFIITVFMIFFGLLVFIVGSASAGRSQIEINKLQSELRRLEEEGAIVKAEIAEKYDVVQIEKIATTKLGMSKPKPYQNISISVPKQSTVVQYRVTDDFQEQVGPLDTVMSFAHKIGSWLENDFNRKRT